MNDAAIRKALRFDDAFEPFERGALDRSVVQRFAQSVQRYPDKPAVRFGARSLSYAELNRAANRHARLLVARGAQPGLPVALMLEPGIALVTWILAILKAGLAYAPLDPRLPQPALARMLRHLQPRALIAAPKHRGRAAAIAADTVVLLDETQPDALPGAGNDADLPLLCGPDSLAYIFYTSGSTGLPKGVADSHRKLLHNVLRYTNSLGLGAGDRLSVVQSPSFSGTVSSLFGALLNGGCAVLFDLNDASSEVLSDWLARERITVFHGVPAIFRQLSARQDRYPHLRLLRLEGDRASAADARLFRERFRPDAVLVNGLGATECGLVRQFFVGAQAPALSEGALPIGYPVPDMTVRIVDDEGAELPTGAVGEIVIDSAFLAVGYWNDPEQTESRFSALADGRRSYRSSDLGRLEADGCLTHLGRRDGRPKIAGRFVDTDAIEAALQAIDGVGQAVVGFYKDSTGEQRLAAYIVVDDEADADAGERLTVTCLREKLQQSVEAALLPTAYMLLPQLPLTPDRKLDRRALPAPDRRRPLLHAPPAAARGEVELCLQRIWSQVLELDQIGVDDSFFDLGGDSLRAARVLSLMQAMAQPGFARARVVDLYEYRTIRRLAHALADPGGPSQPAARLPSALGSTPPASPPGLGLPAHTIALVGMAARVPGADDIGSFWRNLTEGRDSIQRFDGTPEQSDGVGCGADPVIGQINARGELTGVDRFDAAFFGMTPRQAAALDPQQRVWLECVHHALEDAGMPWHGGQGAGIGVYAGCSPGSYLWHVLGADPEAIERQLTLQDDDAQLLRISNDGDSIATRTAFLLNLTGPAVNVQSACSTSLVAIAQACAALVAGHCRAAIAGGVSIAFPQRHGYRYFDGGIRSHDGRCRSFDAGASGTVFSDGVGVVVLKRLDDALADGDRIHALIRGWAVNNDGADKASFSAPSVAGQTRAITAAHAHAAVDSRDIGYVEAHGTATPVGDPIEVEALTRAFRAGSGGRGGSDERAYCALGSVKSNIGHLDSAAGVAGLIKTVLALEHRLIPATVHFRRPNPAIDFAATPFFVCAQATPWSVRGGTRLAGVSSFGVGGTNCHLVLEQAPDQAFIPTPDPRPAVRTTPQLLTLSARSQPALRALLADYQRWLGDADAPALPGLAAATQRSRGGFEWRAAIVAGDAREAAAVLEAAGRALDGIQKPSTTMGPFSWGRVAGAAPRVGFVFTGQGAQFAGMGRGLYDDEPGFRADIDHCADLLAGHLDVDLREVLYGPRSASLIDDTAYAQPALFAHGWSLARLLMRCGVVPDMAAGHSMGEYLAACIADVFSLKDGLELMAHRGRLMAETDTRGRMVAISAPLSTVRRLVADCGSRALAVAACNSPEHAVVSGDAESIGRFVGMAHGQGWHCVPLNVSRAFHSPLLDGIAGSLSARISAVTLRPPRLPVFGNLHGGQADAQLCDPLYWSQQARQTVRFDACIRAMLDAGCRVFIEIGPAATLAPLIELNVAAAPESAVTRMPSVLAALGRGVGDALSVRRAIAALHVAGVPIDWRALRGEHCSPAVDLPPYPFQRERYWYEPARSPAAARRDDGDPLLGHRLRLPGSRELRFERLCSAQWPTYLQDHRLFGVPVVPGASHFAMLVQAASHLSATEPVCYEQVYLLRPLLFDSAAGRRVQLVFKPTSHGWDVSLLSAPVLDAVEDEDWTLHLIAQARIDVPRAQLGVIDVETQCRNASAIFSGGEFYERIWANQGGTGRSFRWIDKIWADRSQALCRASAPAHLGDLSRHRLHPGLLESACQVLHACGQIESAEQIERDQITFVPFSVDRIRVAARDATPEGPSGGASWCHARLLERSGDSASGDLSVADAQGRIVALIEGFRLRVIGRDAVDPHPAARAPLLAVPVVPAASAVPAGTATPGADPLSYLRVQLSAISGHAIGRLESDASFVGLGMDSVMAVMLVNRLRRDLGSRLSVSQVLRSESIGALAKVIGQDMSAPLLPGGE